MVGVLADAHVEAVFAAVLDHVLVGADTGGLQRLRGQVLALVRYQVNAQRELVHSGLLAAQVEDADLRI